MVMKKLFTIFLLLFLLVGCWSSETISDETSSSEVSTSETTSSETKISDSKMSDCEKACENVPEESQSICLSTCQKAAAQYSEQWEELETSEGKTSSQCERFSWIAKNSCYAGLAMDEKDPEYCDNIANSAERSECVDNAQ